jgi:hypothetical protein
VAQKREQSAEKNVLELNAKRKEVKIIATDMGTAVLINCNLPGLWLLLTHIIRLLPE